MFRSLASVRGVYNVDSKSYYSKRGGLCASPLPYLPLYLLVGSKS